MSEFIMVNHSQNEQRVLWQAVRTRGSPAAPCFGQLPELGAFLSAPNGAPTAQPRPRRKGQPVPEHRPVVQPDKQVKSRSPFPTRRRPAPTPAGRAQARSLPCSVQTQAAHRSASGRNTHSLPMTARPSSPWTPFHLVLSPPFPARFCPPASASLPPRACLLALRSVRKHDFLRTWEGATRQHPPAPGSPLAPWALPCALYVHISLRRRPALSCDSEPRSQLPNTVPRAPVPARPRGTVRGKEARAPRSSSKWGNRGPRTTSPPDRWRLRRQAPDSVLRFLSSFLGSTVGKYNSSP